MRINRIILLPMALLVLGASPSLSASHPRTSERVQAQGCELPSGWEEVATRRPRFVVFGELHGTKEAPAFLGSLACALASRGERVLVAVEHSSSRNEAFQDAWQLPQSMFADALKQAGWAGRLDGVASTAMADLLIYLHSLKEAGHFIDIVAFNGFKDETQASRFSHLPAQGRHEAAQAENIRAAASAKTYDHVLILIGNIHARKRPVERSGDTFEPMALQLAPPTEVVTLNMETAGGTIWNCQLKPGVKPDSKKPIGNDEIACGIYPLHGSADLRHDPLIKLSRASVAGSNDDYDGSFWLGAVSASPPAVR